MDANLTEDILIGTNIKKVQSLQTNRLTRVNLVGHDLAGADLFSVRLTENLTGINIEREAIVTEMG